MHIEQIIYQPIIFILISPLLSGVITKIKNFLRLRKGQSIFQPYLNLLKYFAKEETVSKETSWIFRITPYIVFASTLSAAVIMPTIFATGFTQYIGDFIAVILLFSLGRFFLALSGLDPATTFGGMGASREMFISSFIEPVAVLSVFAVSLASGSTNLAVISDARSALSISTILAIAAFFLITLVETSRIPIDNQETHLELTMIHEAMLLEYSGRSLALLELSSYIKQMVFFSILAMILSTIISAQPLIYFAILLAIALVVAVIEVSIAKMRLFRVVDFIAFAGIVSILSIISRLLGL